MLLVHYTDKPIGTIRSEKQKSGLHEHTKPCGLWLSVEDGDGWKEWCEAEQWGLERLAFSQVVMLKARAQILHIRTVEDIDAFTSRYSVPEPWSVEGRQYVSYPIDWQRVARDHQGMIIAPYQWERRLHMGTSWYYGWDCSSGCIWDAAAIQSVAEPEALAA